jgi:hypothetical protein
MRPIILLAGDTYALDRSTKTNYPVAESKTTVSAAPFPVAQYPLISQSGSHSPPSFSQSPSQASSSVPRILRRIICRPEPQKSGPVWDTFDEIAQVRSFIFVCAVVLE